MTVVMEEAGVKSPGFVAFLMSLLYVSICMSLLSVSLSLSCSYLHCTFIHCLPLHMTFVDTLPHFTLFFICNFHLFSCCCVVGHLCIFNDTFYSVLTTHIFPHHTHCICLPLPAIPTLLPTFQVCLLSCPCLVCLPSHTHTLCLCVVGPVHLPLHYTLTSLSLSGWGGGGGGSFPLLFSLPSHLPPTYRPAIRCLHTYLLCLPPFYYCMPYPTTAFLLPVPASHPTTYLPSLPGFLLCLPPYSHHCQTFCLPATYTMPGGGKEE